MQNSTQILNFFPLLNNAWTIHYPFHLTFFSTQPSVLPLACLGRVAQSVRSGRSGDRIPVGGRDFPHLFRPALGPTQPPVQWVFPGGKERPERDADPSPPSSAVVMKG
jgi:hypothetical protein